MFQSLVERARGKALEVRALAAGDIDDLDIFAGAHEIGLGRRLVDADILNGIGQRLGQVRLVRRANAAPPDVKPDRRCGILCADIHGATRGCDDQEAVAGDGEFAGCPRSRVAAEQGDGAGFGKIDAAPFES